MAAQFAYEWLLCGEEMLPGLMALTLAGIFLFSRVWVYVVTRYAQGVFFYFCVETDFLFLYLSFLWHIKQSIKQN